jgi:predicted nucleic acid-binding protein
VRDGWEFFAPSIISAEVWYVLCQKAAQGILTEAEYKQSVKLFINYMSAVASPDGGDSSLIKRAEEIRDGYGCSRSSDGFYIALAEELAKTRTTELLTFDKGFINQTAKNAPTVTVTLLPI